MKPAPSNFPRLSTAVVCRDALAHIDWLCRAFGFERRLVVPGEDGQVEHSELGFAEALVMVSQERPAKDARFGTPMRSPLSAGGVNTQSIMLYVDDVDAHCATARAAGARITSEPALHDYGPDHWADRSYGAVDPEGHHWWFAERVRG